AGPRSQHVQLSKLACFLECGFHQSLCGLILAAEHDARAKGARTTIAQRGFESNIGRNPAVRNQVVHRTQSILKRFQTFGQAREPLLLPALCKESFKKLEPVSDLLDPDPEPVPLPRGQAFKILSQLTRLFCTATQYIPCEIFDRHV